MKELKYSLISLKTPKQMPQRLLIAPAQVKTANTSENLLNEIEKWYIFCIEEKKLLNKYEVCNNIMNSIKL